MASRKFVYETFGPLFTHEQDWDDNFNKSMSERKANVNGTWDNSFNSIVESKSKNSWTWDYSFKSIIESKAKLVNRTCYYSFKVDRWKEGQRPVNGRMLHDFED